MENSKSKTQILLLRGDAASDSLNDAYGDLQSLPNVNVIQISVLTFVFINLEVLTKSLDNPSDYEGIVFTSPRAVEAVSLVKASFQESWSRWIEHKSVYVVGEATASKVHQLLGWQSRGEEAGNAANLAQIITKSEKPGTKLLFPCGNLRRNELAEGLIEAKIDLHPVVCYQTQPRGDLHSIIDESDTDHNLDYVVFFSPSGVKAALPLLRKKWPHFDTKTTTKVALGPTTAECLREHGCQDPLIAAKPNAQSLMTLIKEAMCSTSSSII